MSRMAMASQADKEFYSETVKCDPGTPDTRQNTWILHWSLLDNTCIVADMCRVCGRNIIASMRLPPLEEWCDGPVYEWCDGPVYEWCDGPVYEWCDGSVYEWW